MQKRGGVYVFGGISQRDFAGRYGSGMQVPTESGGYAWMVKNHRGLFQCARRLLVYRGGRQDE